MEDASEAAEQFSTKVQEIEDSLAALTSVLAATSRAEVWQVNQ